MRVIRYLCCVFLWAGVWMASLWSQDSLSQIRVVARPAEKKIMLRWAPVSPVAWQYLNRYGYFLERYTLYRNSKFLDNPLPTRKELGIVRPWEKSQFQQVIDTSDRLAIIAQAIYGESFVVESQTATQLLMNRAEELQNRFTFCLLAAGQSLLAARAAGLYYEDTQIEPGAKYVYRIIPLVPDTIEKIDTGYVYIGTDDLKPLPKPLLLSVTADGKQVTLKWDRKHFEKVYLYYIVERSIDGVHFEPINPLPYLNLSSRGDEEVYVRMDTLPDFNTLYYYRIKGVTLFEEVGPPSDVLSVTAEQKITVYPTIREARPDSNRVILMWDFPAEFRQKLKGFQVLRGSNVQQIVEPLSQQLIPPSDSVFVDIHPSASNYYKIRAIDQQGKYVESLAAFVAMEDSIPPLPPTGLQATIDSTGWVTLSWLPNAESDILGYQVFRANYSQEEFLQVSTQVVTDTVFTEKIGLGNLTSQIYYRIRAIDRHYNPSDFSSILRVRKPDIIPPQPPAIIGYKVQQGIVTITFEPSSSEDVKQYLAYRKSETDSLWVLCAVSPAYSTNYFSDTCREAPCYFSYRMLAVDSAGNESAPSQELKIKMNAPLQTQIEKMNLYAIKNKAKQQIELYWDNLPVAGVKYQIFRSLNNGKYTMVYSFTPDVRSYIDRNIEPGNIYTYLIINRQVGINKGNKISVTF